MYRKLILLDIHTQRDLLTRGGALYIPEATSIARNVQKLFSWARATETPAISAQILLRPGRRGPFSETPHCLEGTQGASKIPGTMLPRRVNLGLAHTADLPPRLFDEYQQAIFETRDPDVFRHQKFERLISELPNDITFVLCGATVEYGIKQAVLGLRLRRYPVIVADDAVLQLGGPESEMAWLQVLAKAAAPLPTTHIVGEFAPSRRSRLPA